MQSNDYQKCFSNLLIAIAKSFYIHVVGGEGLVLWSFLTGSVLNKNRTNVKLSNISTLSTMISAESLIFSDFQRFYNMLIISLIMVSHGQRGHSDGY